MVIKFEIYKDKRKEYRWRARNGKIVAVGGEGFKEKKPFMEQSK